MLGGDDSAGAYNAPGLPDITGWLTYTAYGGGTGAFSSSAVAPGGLQSGGTGYIHNTTFQASRSSTTYGASPTVMPPSVDIPVILYLGRAAQI